MSKVFLKAYSRTIYAWLFTSAVTIGFHWQVHQSSIVTATNCVRLSWDSLVNVTNVVNPNLGKNSYGTEKLADIFRTRIFTD